MSDKLQITREESETKGRYVAHLEGVAGEGEMTYSRAGATRIIIDHTEIPGSMRGLHVGEALVRRAVEDARNENIKILPLCPFAKAMIEKHTEWRDVLD